MISIPCLVNKLKVPTTFQFSISLQVKQNLPQIIINYSHFVFHWNMGMEHVLAQLPPVQAYLLPSNWLSICFTVIRCRDLQRSHGTGSINAYVKVALAAGITATGTGTSNATNTGISTSTGSKSNSSSSLGRFQRTAVHRHSSRPYFDEHLSFAVQEPHMLQGPMQLQLAVWHRDRHLK